jgi:protein gp37
MMPTNIWRVDPSRIPLPNVWLGVSAEDQRRAEERIPLLLDTPAAIRFLSAEPLLGAIELHRLRYLSGWMDAIAGYVRGGSSRRRFEHRRLDWIIVGGESGPNARPMHPDWARSLRDQCAAAGVPFFFKQWGEWEPSCATIEGRTYVMRLDGSRELKRWGDNEQPEAPGSQLVWRVGKRCAGRLLDGRQHNDMPEVRP